ncbi:MAG: cation diffusion facilitator family transporter [Pseudomonadales bacterium]|nr:cation diffusion facilitator family transporter [Pseudomonadales bacterium]
MHKHAHSDNNDSSRRIGWAFFLNVGFSILEFIGGWLTNSTAIMVDAVHDLGDSLSIGLAWLLNKVSDKSADESFSYGYQRFSLLGALINGVVLVGGSIWVLSEVVPRLFSPQMPHAEGMIALAIFGVLVNGFAAYKLSAGKSLNERVLNWHLLEDVLGWLAVLIVAIILLFVDLPILDPVLSIGFTLFILINVVKNLIATIRIFLQATPDKAIRLKIINDLQSLTYVSDIHHIHLWPLDGNNYVLTAHLTLNNPVDALVQANIKGEIATLLVPYGLSHTTIELEFPNESCRDKQ